jgi:hypothetical protein
LVLGRKISASGYRCDRSERQSGRVESLLFLIVVLFLLPQLWREIRNRNRNKNKIKKKHQTEVCPISDGLNERRRRVPGPGP